MASPKASKEDQVQVLFAKLAPQIKGQQHKKAVRTLDSILKLQPTDQDAIKCKVAVLLEGATFQEAFDYIAKSGEIQTFAFEEAYALYRLNRLQEALQKLQQHAADTPAKFLLEAQLQHRMNNYAAAIEIYNQLVQQRKVKPADVGTNVVAAYVSGGRSHEVPAVMAALSLSASDGFELAFNRACAELSTSKLQEAEQQLLLAQRLGKESLYEDDLPEDEIEAELAPLTTQLAHVVSQLGRSGEASTSYQELISKGKADENVLAVAQNNLVALQSAGHAQQKRFAGEALKKLEALLDQAKPGHLLPNLETRLSEQQKQTLLVNHSLLLVLGNKTEACQGQLQHLKARYQGSAQVALLEASIQAKTGNGAAAEQTLTAVQGSDGNDLQAILMRAQMAVGDGNIAQAANILGSIQDPELQHKPAVLATCLALLEQHGDVAGAISRVQEGLQWWQNSMTAEPAAQAAAQSWLQQQMVHLQLKAGDKSKAAEAFQQLQALDRTSSASAMMLGQLARASANGNPQAAVALQKQLPPMPKLSSNIDVDELEQKGGRKTSGAARKRPSEADLAGGAAGRQKKKRKRKPRLPKGFDPENPGPQPDPERWLPKWQRSDFKKKRNRRREKETVKGSQGAGRVDESLDSSIAGNEPVADPSKPKAPARPAGAKGKKKGRR